jgi:hypothetical protein
MKRFVFAVAVAALAAGCGSTGGHEFTFAASAAGPADAPGGPLSFTTKLGYAVTLNEARLHIGGVYLNQTVFGGGPETARGCFSAGIYSAEVRSPLDVDLLSATPQPFAAPGDAITVPAKSAEVWLNGGAIDTVDDTTPILRASGSAEKDGVAYPFSALLTIGRNRDEPSSNPALPGLNPICKQRIVRPIVVDIDPTPGHALVVRADPRAMFDPVDFAQLTQNGDRFAFANDDSDVADQQLYGGLRAESGTYQLEWN